MRLSLFGTYNRGHSSNRIYRAAARAAGFEVVEIHVPLWEKTRDKDARYFSPSGLLRLAAAWIVAACRLVWRWHASGGSPVALVGFNGQLDVLLLRLLTLRYGPRVVFAPLVSVTETLVDDRGRYAPDGVVARAFRMLDRFCCRAADVVVADTQAHRRYLVERLGVDPGRVVVCHLGADNETFRPLPEREREEGTPLEVLYFGQYLPLHGLDVVVDAVGKLSTRDDLRFTFLGTGEERPRVQRLVHATRARAVFEDWVPYEKLAERIGEADIVLGVFGASEKARIVVPNKVYEAALVGRAVVTADTTAIREVFTDGENIALCRADGADLARAIAQLAGDAAKRRAIGRAASELMQERFSDAALGKAWAGALGVGMIESELMGEAARLGVAVIHYNGPVELRRCLESMIHVQYDNLDVLVVENGSQAHAHGSAVELVAAHARAWDRRMDRDGRSANRSVGILALERNLGFTGGCNAALAELFARGCDYVLLLNQDTVVTPEAFAALVASARRNPGAGPIGPRVAADWPGAPPASRGERYWAVVAWLPRSLLRVRVARQLSYPVGGVTGCAFLVSRALYEKLGGFDDGYFAYYEEVDYCLRAREAGMMPRVEPNAEIAHGGHRGFGGGMTPVSAYLKARNLWRLGATRLTRPQRFAFSAGYFLMIGASMVGYLLRRRVDLVRVMAAGVAAALRGETGAPPPWVLEGGSPP
jgi:GT2 family glycosyltransferase/glycosyltransferase involved in cell wall biosynthesis